METVDTGGIVSDDIPVLAEEICLLFTNSISFDDDEEETYNSDLSFGGNSGFGKKYYLLVVQNIRNYPIYLHQY